MKIAVECQSPLLQKSLEIFLTKHLTSVKNCDIVIRDVECLSDERCFYIASNQNADLIKPFSKSQLFLALEKRYKDIKNRTSYSVEKESSDEHERIDFEILEKRIELLTKEYQEKVLNAVRVFYEN